MLKSAAAIVLLVLLGSSAHARSSARTREVVPLAVGTLHACAILRDGQVNCWGHGGLGNGMAQSTVGVLVTGLTDVIALAASENSSCALRADGTVRCWGENQHGQLGDGTTIGRTTPVTVVGLGQVVALAAGIQSYCARLANGQVRCWGQNLNGELGDGSQIERSTPVAVTGLDKVISLEGGRSHFCASTAAGLVYCWGSNSFGQLGQASRSFSTVALQVPNLSNIKQAATGSDSSCALNGQGQVSCWGTNIQGELGRGYFDASVQSHPVPEPVVSLTHVVRLAHGGGKAMCTIRSDDGQLWCWGGNSFGQLGIGTTSSGVPTPTQATSVGGAAVFVATSVDEGPELGYGFTCVLRGNGIVRCTGMNVFGMLGDGTTTDRSTFVSTILTGPAWNGQDISAGEATTCASKDDGTTRCWGNNNSGQLGVGDTASRLTPTDVVGLFTTTAALTANSGHSCVLMTDGTAACMGGNVNGSLGDGTLTARNRATDVSGLVTEKTVTSISAGFDHHTCVALSDGRAKCWGANSAGQIGDGSVTERLTPTYVYNLNSVVQITTGAAHSCALLLDGRVKCWGANDQGELGDGTTTRRVLPQLVVGLATNAIAIAAGRYHTCAQLVDDTVQCWGANYYGQLGANTSAGWWTTPLVVRSPDGSVLHGAVALSSGNDHGCAILASGGLTCWGDNYYHQLGDGTVTQRNAATPIAGLSLLSRIGAGWTHGCARRANGTTWCWGDNTNGEIGDGTTTPRATPVQLSTSQFP